MKTYHSIILMIFLSSLLNGQQRTLKVVAESGLVRVKLGGELNWEQAFVNDVYLLNSKIRLGVDSYICLVDSNLNTYEIRKSGDYDLLLIDSLLTSKNNSVNKNIKNFFLHEILTKKEKFNEMYVLASVIRSGDYKIEIPIPSHSSVFSNSATLKWYPYLAEKEYLVHLFNNKNELIYMREVKDTTLIVDDNMVDFITNNYFKWFVQCLNNNKITSDTIYFEILSKNKREEISASISILYNDFLIKDSPLNQLLIAKYYEHQNLYFEAESYYEKAIQIAPKTVLYWYEYVQFLARNKLYNKIEYILDKSPFDTKKSNLK